MSIRACKQNFLSRFLSEPQFWPKNSLTRTPTSKRCSLTREKRVKGNTPKNTINSKTRDSPVERTKSVHVPPSAPNSLQWKRGTMLATLWQLLNSFGAMLSTIWQRYKVCSGTIFTDGTVHKTSNARQLRNAERTLAKVISSALNFTIGQNFTPRGKSNLFHLIFAKNSGLDVYLLHPNRK